MQRERVASSVIASVGYDPDDRILEIEFHTGRIYDYFGVAPSVHEALRAAGSLGHYFNEHIREQYEWAEVAGPAVAPVRRRR
jgi:hypothetical protein